MNDLKSDKILYPPKKCNGGPYICYGQLDATNLLNQLTELKSELWEKYDFRNKAPSIPHTHNGKRIDQPTHKNTNTIPIYWLIQDWIPNQPATILRFIDYESLYPWIHHLYNFLKKNGAEDGIVVSAMFAKLLPKTI